MSINTNVAICLWFDGQAEEAAEFYTSLIPDSEITNISRPAEDQPALMVMFTLGGVPFQALNGGPQYRHSEAVSISVTCKDQEETDRLWDALTADGGSEGKCAWLKDRFGVSWQIVPAALSTYIGSSDCEASGRAMKAMLGMNKIIISELEAAFNGK
jgi:predicted 3-demethylubiquinone-9 3-methyltransferase (glyoxalase superfamily)